MGSKNPDRWPAEDWRCEAETVGDMMLKGWAVQSRCLVCGLLMETDLKLLCRVVGPTLSLWNVRKACRRVGCTGMVAFQAKPPGRGGWLTLEAEWPGHRPSYPKGQR